MIIDNNTMQSGYGDNISRCDDVIIDTTKIGDVLHVLGVGPKLFSIYCITHIKISNYGQISGF